MMEIFSEGPDHVLGGWTLAVFNILSCEQKYWISISWFKKNGRGLEPALVDCDGIAGKGTSWWLHLSDRKSTSIFYIQPMSWPLGVQNTEAILKAGNTKEWERLPPITALSRSHERMNWTSVLQKTKPVWVYSAIFSNKVHIPHLHLSFYNTLPGLF